MRVVLSALIVLLVAGAAPAQIDPDPDGIGIYFDTGADYAFTHVTPLTVFDAYVCLTRPSNGNGVGGYELRVVDPPYVIRAGWSLGMPGQSLLSSPDFLVGFHEPLPDDDVVVLVHLQYFNLEHVGRQEFYIEPLDAPSIPGAVCYADGADPRVLIPMWPSTGGFDNPVAVINDEHGVIANEDSAWGRVKSLYGEVSE